MPRCLGVASGVAKVTMSQAMFKHLLFCWFSVCYDVSGLTI